MKQIIFEFIGFSDVRRPWICFILSFMWFILLLQQFLMIFNWFIAFLSAACCVINLVTGFQGLSSRKIVE